MVNNILPFDDSDLTKMITRQINRSWNFSSKVEDKLSTELKDLIRQMLEPDANKRPTITKVLRHPWLRDTSGVTGISLTAKTSNVVGKKK
uniref:Protein kinase domain-containing protein n=2 Tax=Tetranychus urticae TaxID=32264 RepID=T1K3Z9_TETUR